MRLVYLSFFLIFSSQLLLGQRPFHFSIESRTDSIYLLVENRYPCPFYLKQSLEQDTVHDFRMLDRLQLEVGEKKICTVFPNRFPYQPELKVLNKFIDIRFVFGHPFENKIDTAFQYQLPFPKNKKYRLTQGFNGRFSHRSDWSRYAIDIAMREGDTICAARGGVVCWVIEHNTEGGAKRRFLPKANVVIIYHEDGSFAHYAHLKHNGALVKVGDRVKMGQKIALSGNTGFTTRPHLHFVVRKSAPKELVAIPIRFKGIKPRKLYRWASCLKHPRD